MQVLYLGDALKVVEVSPEGDEGTPVLLVLKRVEEEEVEVAERRERPVVSAVGHCPMGYRPSESAVQTLKSVQSVLFSRQNHPLKLLPAGRATSLTCCLTIEFSYSQAAKKAGSVIFGTKTQSSFATITERQARQLCPVIRG